MRNERTAVRVPPSDRSQDLVMGMVQNSQLILRVGSLGSSNEDLRKNTTTV